MPKTDVEAPPTLKLCNVDEDLMTALDNAVDSLQSSNDFRSMRSLVVQLIEYGYTPDHVIAVTQLNELRKYEKLFPQFPLKEFIDYIAHHPSYFGSRINYLLNLPKERMNEIVDFFLDCYVMYGKFHVLTWRELYEQEPAYFRWCVAKSKMRQFNVERYVAFSALLMS